MRGVSYGLEGKSGSTGPLECTAGNEGEIDSTSYAQLTDRQTDRQHYTEEEWSPKVQRSEEQSMQSIPVSPSSVMLLSPS